jgi:hypothetical protein
MIYTDVLRRSARRPAALLSLVFDRGCTVRASARNQDRREAYNRLMRAKNEPRQAVVLTPPLPGRGDYPDPPRPYRTDEELGLPVPVTGGRLWPPLPAWELQELTVPIP